MKLNQSITNPDFLLCIMHDAFKDNFMNKDRDILVENSYFANKTAIRNSLYNLKLRGFAEYNDAGFWIVTDAGQNHAKELMNYYGFDFSDIRPNDYLYQNEENNVQRLINASIEDAYKHIAKAYDKRIADAFKYVADAFNMLLNY